MPSRKSVGEPPGFLLEALQARTVIPIIGAGLSMAAEASIGSRWEPAMPDHRTLLRKLLASSSEIDDASKKVVELHLGREDDQGVVSAARELREELGNQFYSRIRDILEPIDSRLRPSLAHQILKIIDFPYILTTNYDRLLERFVATGHEVVTPKDSVAFSLFDIDKQRGRRKYVVKLHGDITRPDTIPFGGTELLAHYGINPDGSLSGDSLHRLLHFMSQVFTHSTVLFLGISLSDQEAYLQVLEQITRREDWLPSSKHCALVPVDRSRSKLRAHLKKRLNIHFVEYEPDEAHSQVWEFLSFLGSGRPVKPPVPGEGWEKWYLEAERTEYLREQLSREKTATSVLYLTPTLTNGLATEEHLDITCKSNLEAKYGKGGQSVALILEQMTARADNVLKRLQRDGMEVRALFLETEFRKSLDTAVKSVEELEIALGRYSFVLALVEQEVDLEFRFIRGISSGELAKRGDSFALIFNSDPASVEADVTVAYSTQATKEHPEIHMIHTNTSEVRDRLYEFEKLWAGAMNEPDSIALMRKLLQATREEMAS